MDGHEAKMAVQSFRLVSNGDSKHGDAGLLDSRERQRGHLLFNWLVSRSDDRSGSGMVLMFTIPIALVVALVSLVIVGFLT